MEPSVAGRWLDVVAPGVRSTVQDLGRPGHGAIGISPSGAADRGALRLANRLVGTAESAPAVEVSFGGLVLRARGTVMLAVTGADRPLVCDGRAVALRTPLILRDGSSLHIGTGGPNVYSYVAVAGGFAIGRQLGSAATDVLGGIGPLPLRAGDVLQVGHLTHEHARVDIAPVAVSTDPVELRVMLGPRATWVAPDALDLLCAGTWTVSGDSNRVALRLRGEALVRLRRDELDSEGIIRGAVQIPPDGMPVVFGPDHPTTGGYPVIAVVVDADLDVAAQAAPGARVRFRRV